MMRERVGCEIAGPSWKPDGFAETYSSPFRKAADHASDFHATFHRRLSGSSQACSASSRLGTHVMAICAGTLIYGVAKSLGPARLFRAGPQIGKPWHVSRLRSRTGCIPLLCRLRKGPAA